MLRPLTLTAALALPATPLTAQVGTPGADTLVEAPDPDDLLDVAQAAQARFELRRTRELPVSLGGGWGECDERVGRFCTWYDEGEWTPGPEPPEVAEMRTELIAVLDSIQRHLPGDPWVLGQRVWYRTEAGDWPSALATARACGEVDPWWCAALEGFALHNLGRYPEALASFDRALAAMDAERAHEWRLPLRAVEGDVRDALDDLAEGPPDSLARALDRLWALADPLYLVEGNDRLTEHYARWVVATVREGARNPFRISWGNDLEELTIRHGWEIGWERSQSRGLELADNIIGHKHPEGSDYMPPGRAFLEPAAAEAEDFLPDRLGPRSLYAPAYAPVLLPIEPQVAVFPRTDSVVVVAGHYLPVDTTHHADHAHDRPWMEPGAQAHMPAEAGIFLISMDAEAPSRRAPAPTTVAPPRGPPGAPTRARGGATPAHQPARAPPSGATFERVRTGTADGVLQLAAPAGAYVLSVETWSPPRRLAGRLRRGLTVAPVQPDIPVLSDILMLAPPAEEPESLAEAVPRALRRTEIRPGQTFAIAWEVAGLGFRPETLAFDLSVERTDRGFLSRIGGLFGLSDRPRPLTLSWQEPAPSDPQSLFRYLNLDLPDLDEGDYEVLLTLRTAGRTEVATVRAFTVREGALPPSPR